MSGSGPVPSHAQAGAAQQRDAPPLRPRPRVPRGKRPNNLGDPNVERLLSITMAIATEVSALHQKVDTVVRVASARGLFDPAEIAAYLPTPEVEAEWAAWRKAYLQRLLRIMWETLPDGGGPQAAARDLLDTVIEETSR